MEKFKLNFFFMSRIVGSTYSLKFMLKFITNMKKKFKSFFFENSRFGNCEIEKLNTGHMVFIFISE